MVWESGLILRNKTCQTLQPVGVWDGVRSKLFESTDILLMEIGAVWAESARLRAIHKLARIGDAHLEQNARAEFSHCLTIEGTLEARQRVGPDNNVNADRRTIANDARQDLIWFSGGISLGIH